MTIAMADKLVTSFRFTGENKGKKEGLNSVFTDFIICRLTETTISKSRDVWRQSGGVRSVAVMDSVLCFVHVIDTKQLHVSVRLGDPFDTTENAFFSRMYSLQITIWPVCLSFSGSFN